MTKPRVSLRWEKKRSNFSKLIGSSTKSLWPRNMDAVRTLFSAARRMIDRISARRVSSTKVGWWPGEVLMIPLFFVSGKARWGGDVAGGEEKVT